MYTCTFCGKKCNRVTNIFITNDFCDDCLDLYYSGKLFRRSKKKEEIAKEKADMEREED